MLSRPSVGWTRVKIGNFSDRASCLTDIPIECLRAFVYSFKNNRPAVIKFDAEGWEYIIVVDDAGTHIISDNYDTDYIYESIEVKKTDIATELVFDIEEHLYNWIMWNSNIFMYSDFYNERKNEIRELLSELKQFLI